MAAPTEAGYGETVEHEKGSTGLGLSAEDPIGFDEKNGSEEEDVQVAKKPRVEKTTENGLGDAAADDNVDDDGVEGLAAEKDVVDPELDPLLAPHNGTTEGDDEDDEENGDTNPIEDVDELTAADDTTPATTGTTKDASGDAVGLRTLLQEGDAPSAKSTLLNGTEDASHMLNGAK